MVDRRDFLKTSTLIGVGTAAAACASRPGDLLIVPSSDLTAADMEAYLTRLDRSMNSITVNPSPIVKIFPEKKFKLDDPVMKSGDELLRKNLRSLLLVGSFRDLPEEGRVYPGMQARMWGAMGEMDESMRGMHQALSALTPTERADIGRALRADPELGMRIVEAFDAESAAQGVSIERRMHLRSLGIQATNRLRQSTTLFIDEYTKKTEKILNRPVDPEALQRNLLATIGEDEFFALQKRTSLYVEKWRLAQAAPNAQAAPRQPTAPASDPPGTGAITAGAVMLGIGLLVFLISISVGSIEAAFGATAGAILGIAGLITLIIGGAIRAANT